MYWNAIWFVFNILFVASAIIFLFMHRAFAEARLRGDSPDKLARAKLRRTVAAAGSILFFAAMCFSFIANMKVNG